MATPPSPSDADRRAGEAFARLLAIMARLREPDGGCPWDLQQDFATIAPYTIEEAYEVAEAISNADMGELRDELGDLLFQVAFHGQMAREGGHFDAGDVAEAIAEKMIRRHPHVFESADGRDAAGQTEAWEEMKAAERAGKGPQTSALDGVAYALPALMRAEKLQKRAARTGFDWSQPEPILEKLDEEIGEVREAIAGGHAGEIEEEVGDLLFVCANLSRQLKLDPETALRKANDKFERRFRAMETLAGARGEAFSDLTLDAQEDLWRAVKQAEKAGD
ncbi:MAG: nucleoside triphosphate pyrophosphohydrolase [Alphaproteobacteria bacterium]|jgi:MazG family protein|nr:nucleoside triphosphate pyrophosphohydrolase [Alphaproteobacteria bacterium]